MNGAAIGALAIGDAGLQRLATEHGGPRPGGVRSGETMVEPVDARTAKATKP
ncbi:hypothetical protein [Sphingosinicella sp.]|uniref:hypothetical protein n=1 Tax=Sphingosinicella sp. TaxID=1917971 RepID=UPI004037D69E